MCATFLYPTSAPTLSWLRLILLCITECVWELGEQPSSNDWTTNVVGCFSCEDAHQLKSNVLAGEVFCGQNILLLLLFNHCYLFLLDKLPS